MKLALSKHLKEMNDQVLSLCKVLQVERIIMERPEGLSERRVKVKHVLQCLLCLLCGSERWEENKVDEKIINLDQSRC